MGKIKLISILGILFLFNNFALANKADNDFYFKAIIGINKICSIDIKDTDINFRLKQSSKPSPILGVGVGYYINSILRTDLIIEASSFDFNTDSSNFFYSDNIGSLNGTQLINRHAHAQSVMLNGYANFITIRTFKLFIGSGFGISSIKEMILHELNSDIIINNTDIVLPPVWVFTKNKQRNYFSYMITIGTEINITRNLNIELAYRWKHHGTAKHNNVINRYYGDSILLTARFDL